MDVRAEVERIVTEEQRRLPIPGVSVGIASGGDDTLAAFGVTSVENALPVTADTIFQIGSISKTFLGTLVMRLVDEGKLDLDVPVRRWVPELRLRDGDAAARVTLRHCLTHTCGWFGDHFIDTGWNDDALARYVATMSELEQQVPLGTEWAYNNAAFALAGHVVERVTDQAIEHAMRHRLFVPLGLERTFFFANSVLTHRFAVGHNVFEEEPRVVRPWALPRSSNCLGGIASTVVDLLGFARFHMGDGTTADGARYLRPESVALMRSPLVDGPLGAFRGIAWAVEKVTIPGVEGGGAPCEEWVIQHGGATFGQQAMLHVAPAKRAAIAMLTNTNQAAQLQNAMTRWWWERALGVRKDPPRPREYTAEEAERVAGTYRNTSAEIRVAVGDGRLVLHSRPLESGFRKLQRDPPPIPEPVPLAFNSAGRLVLLAGPLKDQQVELLSAEWVRTGGRLYKKVSP